MPDRSLLLALLRFVALVAPAVAILMQVVNDRDSGDGLSVEFELLQAAFTLIVVGGLIIGVQFLQTVNNRLTSLAIALIFASLPFLAIAIWWRNLPARIKPPESASPTESFRYLIFDLIPMALVLILPFVFSGGVYYLVGDPLSAGLAIGFAADLSLLGGEFFLIGVLTVISVKSAHLAFQANGIPPKNVSNAFTATGFYYLIIISVFGVMVLLPYLAAIGAMMFFNTNPTNVALNIPHIWSGVILLLILRMQVDEDDTDGVPDIETQ